MDYAIDTEKMILVELMQRKPESSAFTKLIYH